MEPQALIGMVRERLANLHNRARKSILALGDEDLNWRPNDDSNSITNLVLHLAGNLHQLLESRVGGAPDRRDREAEFEDRSPRTRDQLIQILDDAFAMADRVLADLRPDQLDRRVEAIGRSLTLAELIFFVAVHAAEHVGQIIYIAKLKLGADFGTLSIPRRRA
ncbi:MAG TPA: DinB family protein [Bacillota bacterium]